MNVKIKIVASQFKNTNMVYLLTGRTISVVNLFYLSSYDSQKFHEHFLCHAEVHGNFHLFLFSIKRKSGWTKVHLTLNI